ncbi:MAG: hypothetical protein ACJAY9_000750 [Flavobacteriales bacterium]|jgi:hypothetical protein
MFFLRWVGKYLRRGIYKEYPDFKPFAVDPVLSERHQACAEVDFSR